MPTKTIDLKNIEVTTTPLYAVAGVGDLAVEKLRTIPARLAGLRDGVRDGVRTEVGGVKELPAVTAATLRAIPGQTAHLAASVGERAQETYDELAERGKVLVGRVRRDPATQEAGKQARSTVRRAKATRTTASKSATATKRAAKGAATSATKTADATVTAVESAAEKVGD